MAKQKRVDDFLDLVRGSRLVEREKLNPVLRKLKEDAAGEPIRDTAYVGRCLVEAGLLTLWQCERLLEGRHRGFFLKNYKLLDHLGSGGMSHVYLAEHQLLGRRVAVKVLPTERVNDSSYLGRFHREAQAVAALDHPNIVRAYDHDHEENFHFLVMEYVEGRDLLEIGKEDAPLDYSLAADYIRQGAQGLAHAHEAGLIHRDVKPGNFLVDPSGTVKLLDLGLARFAHENENSLTVLHDENVLGTADYLAPEQALDSHGVDARADIYGLGCSFYYLLAGRPPFPEGTLPQRLMAHQKNRPPSILVERPDAPVDLFEICMRMMAKKPAARPQTAAKVAQMLGDWLTIHDHPGGTGHAKASERLAASLSGNRQGHGRLATAIQTLEPGSDSRPANPQTDSDLKRAKPLSASTSDTASDIYRHTVKGPGQSNSGGKDAVPIAEPVRNVDDDDSVFGFLGSGDSPAVDRLRSRHAASASDTRTNRGLRGNEAPIWVWGLIGAGFLVAIILLGIFLGSG